nr:MAG: polyprotein [Raccoon dog picornavirus]
MAFLFKSRNYKKGAPSSKPFVERFLSKIKCGSSKERFYVYIYILNGEGTIVKHQMIGRYTLNGREMKGVPINCGLASSKLGSRHQSASAGRDSIQINYYGAEYANAKTDPSVSMDPSQFTQPVMDLSKGPTLKSPTVEEGGYSDRIVQITSGNSTITSQEAANAVVAYGVWPDYDMGVGEAVDKMTTPGPSVERFYTFDSVMWTKTSNEPWYWGLPAQLTDMGVFGQNCQYHYLMKSGFCVHLQVNATKFHQGTLLVVAIPEMYIPGWDPTPGIWDHGTLSGDKRDAFAKRYPYAQLPIFPHQLINLRTNNSATLILPYINACPAENAATHNYWTVVVVPIVPLDYAEGSSSEIPITMSIAPMNSAFSGLRNRVNKLQGIPVFEVPGSRQFVTTLHNSGYPLYYEFQKTKSHKMPGRVKNLLEICKVDTFCTASDTDGFFLKYINVNNSSDMSAAIGSWDLSLTATFFSSTIASKISKFFSHYRGSLKVTFTFCGSAMATGKFLIAYTPPGGDAPSSRAEAMQGTHIVWDVGLQSSCTFVIPYISQTEYRFTNINGDLFSYDGFITMWYQTKVVVPVGCPTTCAFTAMASVCDDFEFRIPCDSAYFQGLTDGVTNAMQSGAEAKTESVLRPVELGDGVPTGLSVQIGDSTTLSAPETGATNNVNPSTTMETRLLNLQCSAKETDVENFMSRYALFANKWFYYNARYANIPISFNDENIMLAVRAKYNMFTYVRCDYDFVIVLAPASLVDGVSSSSRTQQLPNVRFQIMFVPPGGQAPDDPGSPAWFLPTNPSIFVGVHDPPCSFRIPFMAPTSYYATNYNGYPTFPDGGIFHGTYGQFPGNNIGSLHVRVIMYEGAADKNMNWRINAEFYVRPVNFEGYMPRPVISFKPNARIASSRGRREYVCDSYRGEVQTVDIGVGEGGSDIVRVPQNTGFSKIRAVKVPIVKAPPYVENYFNKMWLAQLPSGESFHIMPISSTMALCPYHLYSSELLFKKDVYSHLVFCNHKIVNCDVIHDLIMFVTDRPIFHTMVGFCQCCDPEEAYVAIETHLYQYTTYVGKVFPCSELKVGGSQWIGPHTQKDLFMVQVSFPPGSCGAPMICKHGICGMVTASDGEYGWLTNMGAIPYLHVMEQGPMDWLSSMANQMGQAFGDGAIGTAQEEVRRLIDQHNIKVPSVAREVVSLMVKTLCAMILISKSYDKFETAVTIGIMLGADLLVYEPFDWLKRKVSSMLNVPIAEEQGFAGDVSNWIKEFNTACTAAKGLEWIGQKLMAFVEWLKALFKKEDPLRRQFMDQLKLLPTMMEQFDKIETNRGKYDPDIVRKLCNNFRILKQGADIYGVERNQATVQIVAYYKRAMKVLKSLTTGRTEPVAILIHGQPGTGKSLASELIGRALCKMLDADRPYSLPPDPKYFDGYCQQPVVIMDDVGQNPDGEDLKLFCQMVSSTEFQIPMADLEDKGTLFTSKYVLATTNCERLAPVTISEPKALDRRFFLNLDIKVSKDFAKPDGKLDAKTSLASCNHVAVNFKKCCPLICGKAITLYDRRARISYSVDEVVTKCVRESMARLQCGDQLDALFQGKDDTDEIVHVRKVRNVDDIKITPREFAALPTEILTIEEQRKLDVVQEKPMPSEVAELVRVFSGDEAIIEYCKKQGWIIPAKVKYEQTRKAVKTWLTNISMSLSILASLAGLGSFIYLMYRVFANNQGAYTGNEKAPLKRPEPRRQAVVQGPDTEFAIKIMNSSLFDVRTDKGNYSALGLYDQWMVMPLHSDPGDSVVLDGKEYKVLDQVELSNSQGKLELVMVKIDRPVKFRDIRKFIPEHFVAEKECMLVVNNLHFPRMMVPVGTVTMFGFLNLSNNPRYRMCTYRFPTRAGQCGGVIVKSGKIMALHVGGDGLNGYGAILTKSMLGAVEQGEIVRVEKNSTPINVSSRTKLYPSVFHDVFPGEKEPAALHPNDKRLEVDLEEALFAKYKGNLKMPDAPELEIAIDHYVEQLRPIVPENLREQLTLDEAVYGIENLEGIDKKTSAGYPYVIKGIRKGDLIPERGEPLTKLQEALDLHGVDQPFVTYLKDELRPREKVKKGKTRLIECSSLNDTLRMKMKLGRLFQMFHKNPGTVTGSAVGCNPDIHWSQFYREFQENPIMAFDYSNYDASLHPMWFYALKKVLLKLGYKEEDLDCVDHIINSTHLYKTKKYVVEGGMPSGCSGTSVFNSIINNLIVRTLVLRCYKGIDLDELKILAYGDDVIVTYPFQLDASIVAEEGKQFGLTMTPPDKGSDFNEVTWENVTFLKRRFKRDDKFPFLVHPVFPMKEIYESIRWCRSASTTNEHVHSLCLLAWHNGEDVYDDFVQKIRSVPVGRALSIPPFSVLQQYWYDSF